jgi:hypothetical protein
MSSLSESVQQSFANGESEWVVLDRVVALAVYVAPLFQKTTCWNSTEVTIHMYKFEEPCGFTTEISTKLFARTNDGRRKTCEDHGVKFVNAGQDFKVKQIVVEYNKVRPSFAAMYPVAAAVMSTCVEASTQTDPPAVPVAPAVGAEQAAPVPALNIEHYDSEKIVVRCKNNKRKHYYAIPTAAGEQITNYEQFYHAVTAKRWKEMLQRLAGDTKVGVKMLTKVLHGIDQDECLKGIEECGSATFKTLSPAQTVAVMVNCGFSWNQMRKLNSFFLPHNNNISLFASEKECLKLCKVDIPLQFDTFYRPKASTDYWHICPWAALMSTMNNVRDVPSTDGRTIGVKQGMMGDQVIPVVIQGDYGGDLGKGEMKFLQVVILREGDGQKNCVQIASMRGKEEYSMLKQTIMPIINAGVEMMVKNKLLLLSWDDQFDFVPVPAALTLAQLQFIPIEEQKLRVTWDNGADVGGLNFDTKDIPPAAYSLAENATIRFVTILPFSGGDLSYQFTILGRPSHCTSKCMVCKLTKEQWKANPAAPVNPVDLFCMETMVADRTMLEDTYAADPELQQRYSTLDNFVKVYVKKMGVYGVDGLDVLLPAVPMQQYLAPPLHMMLGLVNDLVKLMRAWLVATKLDTPIVKNAPRPVMLNAIEQMLQKDYNVVAHKYHKDTLVGGDCHRLMLNSGDICAKAVDICKKLELRRADVHLPENIDAQIDYFWRRLSNLLAVLNEIYDLMSQTTQLTAEELNQFDLMCSTYGRMWTAYFPGRSVTPKMHLLTKHTSAQMRLFGCLGDKIEAAVERLHKSCNQSNRLFAAMNDWRKMQRASQKRIVLAGNAAVVKAREKAEKSKKRPFSPQAKQRRNGIITDKANKRQAKRNVAVQVIVSFNTPAQHV